MALGLVAAKMILSRWVPFKAYNTTFGGMNIHKSQLFFGLTRVGVLTPVRQINYIFRFISFWDNLEEGGKVSAATRPWTLLQGLLQQGAIGRCCGAWSTCGETWQRLRCVGEQFFPFAQRFPNELRDMLQDPSIFSSYPLVI